MKRFKVGMVLGKFYPFHNGHAFLIDTALANCDFVYVYVCTLPEDYYRGEDRAAWVFEHYRNFYWQKHIKVFHVNDRLPQYPEEHPDFWNIWVDVVKSRASNIEAIFTSEDYGTPFAHHLNVEHVKVDQQRITVPISGTACRGRIYEQWDFLPPEVQDHFRKKICIIGPESTGKSTLAVKLAEHFDANFITEYGREYCERHCDPLELTSDDFGLIGEGQYVKEITAFPKARRVLFCDTDQLVTRAFLRLYSKYGNTKFEQITEDYLKFVQGTRRYDLYLLLTPEVPHIQDGQRDFGKEEHRWEAFDIIHNLVKESGTPFIRIKGSDYNDRVEQAIFWTDTILDTAR